MFCWYIVLYKLIKTLEQNTETIRRNANTDQFTILEALFTFYRRLQIHTIRVNKCYQEKYALIFKPLLMGGVIILGTVMLQPKLTTTSTAEVILCVYSAVNGYIVVAIGYFVPGKVNGISKSILVIFRSIIGQRKLVSSKTRREYSRVIKSFQDIRICIGRVNFYEKFTALNILDLIHKNVNI